jgi:hypothetical protein
MLNFCEGQAAAARRYIDRMHPYDEQTPAFVLTLVFVTACFLVLHTLLGS